MLYTALNLRFTERSRARFNVILSNRVSCDCSNLSGLKQALFRRGLNGLIALSHSMERVEPLKCCIRPNPLFPSAYRSQWCFLNAESLQWVSGCICLIASPWHVVVTSSTRGIWCRCSFDLIFARVIPNWLGSAERAAANALVCKCERRRDVGHVINPPFPQSCLLHQPSRPMHKQQQITTQLVCLHGNADLMLGREIWASHHGCWPGY